MYTAFLFFILGVLTLKIGQFILSVTPNYTVWKHTELTCLKLWGDMILQYQAALKALKIAYENSDNQEEYKEAEKRMTTYYIKLINNGILELKKTLPYKVPYSTIEEAAAYYTAKKKQMETRDE